MPHCSLFKVIRSECGVSGGRPPHEKDNTNMLVEKTKNSREKRNQNSGMSGT
jgi:hypothetical protein